jgi:hypothetical protein
MFRLLSVIAKARTILALWLVGLILLVAAVVSIANGGRSTEIVPAIGVGTLAVVAGIALARRALAREAGGGKVEELIRANRAKIRLGPRAENENGEPGPSEPAVRICVRCASTSEFDARFCKRCGEAIPQRAGSSA